jgi:hypothetical protein
MVKFQCNVHLFNYLFWSKIYEHLKFLGSIKFLEKSIKKNAFENGIKDVISFFKYRFM